MSKEKLTDEQIIKALKNCIGSNSCGDCPLLYVKENCRPFLYISSLNLINRLKEENAVYLKEARRIAELDVEIRKENTELKAENERLKTENESLYGATYEDSVVLTKEEYDEIKIYQSYIPEMKKAFDKVSKATAEKIFRGIFGTCNTELIACKVDLEDNGGQYWEGRLSGIRNTIADIMSVAKQFGVEVKE